jgi:hypothetical protein
MLLVMHLINTRLGADDEKKNLKDIRVNNAPFGHPPHALAAQPRVALVGQRSYRMQSMQ